MNEKIKGTQNSHIQLPRSILEGFSVRKTITNQRDQHKITKTVFCMDMEGNISEQDIKEINTEFGYYENEVETKILARVESAFGQIKNKIITALKKRDCSSIEILITETDISAVRKYCSLCVIRSQKFVNDVANKSLMINHLRNEPQNAIAYHYTHNPDIVDKFFAKHNLTFLINQTENNLILPQYGILLLDKDHKTKYDVFIPVAPNLTLLLTQENVMENDRWNIGRLSAEGVVKLNQFAVDIEFHYNHKALYGRTQNDLIMYRDWLLRPRE